MIRRIPRGLLYMALAALSFSVMSALVKASGRSLPTMQIVLARSVVVAVLSGGTLLARRRPLGAILGRERRIMVLRGLLGFVALTCFYYAIVLLPLADATVIQYTNPVFTALLAAPVLGETLRLVEIGLAVASLTGVVMIARPEFLGGGGAALDPLHVAVALAGAVFSAAAYVTVRRLRGEETLVVILYFAGISTVASLPVVIPVWESPGPTGWLVLLAIGGTTHLGQVFLTRGLKEERAGRAMTVGYLQIVFAAVWGALFFGEVPDRWSAAGAAVIVVSTFLLARTRHSTDPAASGGERVGSRDDARP